MSNVLQRLVGQATGALNAGIRPRLPSRFENGLQPDLTEVHAERPVVPSRVNEPGTQPDANAAPYTQAPSATIPDAVGRASDKVSPTPGPEEPDTVVPAARTTAKTPRAREAPLAAPPPTPLLHETVVHVPEAAPVATVPDNPITTGTPSADESQSADGSVVAAVAPAPLLPPDHTGAAEIVAAVSEARSSPGPEQYDDRNNTAPAEPDITIHIGQVDVRSATPEPPKRPRRTTRTRSLPSLSDYLRGDRR